VSQGGDEPPAFDYESRVDPPPEADRTHRCPKCNEWMQAGVVLDTTYGGVTQPRWTPGEPTWSFWRGLKFDKHSTIPVTTYRCPACGFLESYAQP
jgi:predicted RNA-binding Zn-ribbon protein involved in translation (DUF1610 family)